MFLLTIEALLHNNRVNLEYHLHFFVSILLNFLVSPTVSANQSELGVVFREKSALILAKVVNK